METYSDNDSTSISDIDSIVNVQNDDVNDDSEQLIFNPYNNKNIEIQLSDVQDILKKYGVPGKVFNVQLYRRAFVHRSYTSCSNFAYLLHTLSHFALYFSDLCRCPLLRTELPSMIR